MRFFLKCFVRDAEGIRGHDKNPYRKSNATCFHAFEFSQVSAGNDD